MSCDKPGLQSEKPSEGCFFYIVIPNVAAGDRRYVHAIERTKTHTSAPKVHLAGRTLAKRFTSLALCRSYCDFLNRIEGLPDFVVVMEPAHLLRA
jgi:hypothetical protein